MPSESKKQRPAPGSMYFPPTAVASTASSPFSPTSATTTNTTSSPKGSTPGSPYNSFQNPSTTTKALTPNTQLGELLRSIEPRYCFHPAVEELLLEMATEFVQDVVGFSGKLAKHRRSNVLESKDLQFCLAKNYGISLAGVLNAPGTTATATATATTPTPPTTSADATAAVLNPLGQDLLVRAHPAKNSLHMHRIALKRKALLRTKTKLLKSGRGGGGVKASDASGSKKPMRKGSTAMDTK